MASEEEQPEEFEENQENENINKNEPKRQIIIKGRRIQKREKIIQFDDSDETESDDDKKAKHKNRKMEKKEDLNRIFDFRNVFQNKLTGKILTHWNDNTKIEMNLSEAANTVINKFSNTSYDSIFSSNSKNNQLENWDCGFEDSNLTCETVQENNQMPNEKNVNLQEQIKENIKNDQNNAIEKTNESVVEQVSMNKPDENDHKSKTNSTDCNPDGITGKQILDKTFGTQIAPDIVSSFNSWFSDIRSATKLAASTTVSHAVKKLTSNAQHILTNVAGDQSDLIQTNSNALQNCQTEPLKRETDSSNKIDLLDNWETNAWTDDWDDEPIQLNQSSNTLKFEKFIDNSNKELLNSSIYQEDRTCDDSKFSVQTDEKCLENVAYAQQNASAISPGIELNSSDYKRDSLFDDRNRDLNGNKDSKYSQMSEGNNVLGSGNTLNNVASLDGVDENNLQITNLDIDSNGWDMDWSEEKSSFEPVLENVIDEVLPCEEISLEQNEFNVSNGSSSNSSLTTDPSSESNQNEEESLVPCADGWDMETEENDLFTETDQNNLQESKNNSEINIITDLVDNQSDEEWSIELNPTTIVEMSDSVILPEEVGLNNEQSKIETPQPMDSYHVRSDQPQVPVVSESNLPVQLAQSDDTLQETTQSIKESGKDIHSENSGAPSLTADSTKLELNDGWDNDWGQVDSLAKPNPNTISNSISTRSSFSDQPAEQFSRLSDKEIKCANVNSLSTNLDVEWDDELASKVSPPMENVQQSVLTSDLDLEVKLREIPTNEILNQNCDPADLPYIDLTHQSGLISSDNVTQYIPQINEISQSNWTGYAYTNFSNDNTHKIENETSFTNLEQVFTHVSVPFNEHIKMNTEQHNSDSYGLLSPQSIQNEEIKLDLGINELQTSRNVIEQDVSGGHDHFEPSLEQTEDLNYVEGNNLSYDDKIKIRESPQQTEQIVSDFTQFNENEFNNDSSVSYGISHSPNLLSDVNESDSSTFEQTDIRIDDWKSPESNHSVSITSTSGALQEENSIPRNENIFSMSEGSPDYVKSEIDDDQGNIGSLEYPQSKMDSVVHDNLLEDSMESDGPALNVQIDLTNEQILSNSEHKDDMWGDDWNNEWEDQLPEQIEQTLLSEQSEQLPDNFEEHDKSILPYLENSTDFDVTKEISAVPNQQSSENIDQWTGDWGDGADLVSNKQTQVEKDQILQQSEQLQTESNQPLHELERKDAANEKCLSLQQTIDIFKTKEALPILSSQQVTDVADNYWGDDTDTDIMKQDLSFLPKPQLQVIDQWTDDWGDDSDFVQKEQYQIHEKIDLDKPVDEECQSQSLVQTTNIRQTDKVLPTLSNQQLEVVDQKTEDWGDDSHFVKNKQLKSDDFFEPSGHFHNPTESEQIPVEVELMGTIADNINDTKKQDLLTMPNQQLEVIDQWTDDWGDDSDFVLKEIAPVKTGQLFEQSEHLHKQTESDQIEKIGSDNLEDEDCLSSLEQSINICNTNQVLPTLSNQQLEVIDQWTDDWGDDSDFVQKEQAQVKTDNFQKQNEHLFKQAHLNNNQISDRIELKRVVENTNNAKKQDLPTVSPKQLEVIDHWTDWGDDSDSVQKEQTTNKEIKKSISCGPNKPSISSKDDVILAIRKEQEAKSDRPRNINENKSHLIDNTKLNKTVGSSLTHKTKKNEVGNQNTLEEWTTDWDDPDPVILPSQERRSSTLTNISIDSDWSADWELKPKASVAKLQPSASISSSTSRHLKLNDNFDKPLQTLSDWKPVNQLSSNSFNNSPNQSAMSRQSESMSYQTGSRPNASQSASWFSELKSATKNAAVTTMTHAASRWSFNPANLLDAVVDNISNAVGIPSAEEMATVMRKQQKSDKN